MEATLRTAQGWRFLDDHEQYRSEYQASRERLKNRVSTLVTAIIAALLLGGLLVGVAAGSGDVYGADDLTVKERANVMTVSTLLAALQVGNDEGVAAFLSDDAVVALPGGPSVGPDGSSSLKKLIGDDYDFQFVISSVRDDVVELDWRLDGPITPGPLTPYYVPAGSAIAGTLNLVVQEGEIVFFDFEVTS